MRVAFGTVVCVAALAPLAVPADAGIRGASYKGKTAQGHRVALRVTADGRYLASFKIRWRCKGTTGEPSSTRADRSDGIRIRDRRFSARGNYVPANNPNQRVYLRLAGRVGENRARGRFRATARGDNACTSGRIRWRARRVD